MKIKCPNGGDSICESDLHEDSNWCENCYWEQVERFDQV